MKSIRHAVNIVPENTVPENTVDTTEKVIETAVDIPVETLADEPVKHTTIARPRRSYSKHFKSMLSDSHDDNAISSKRVITLLAFVFCTIAFFANLFFGYKIDEFIFNTMAYIVLGGFGVTGLEKFASQNVSIKQEEPKSRWE
jgi:hypothetical protein